MKKRVAAAVLGIMLSVSMGLEVPVREEKTDPLTANILRELQIRYDWI